VRRGARLVLLAGAVAVGFVLFRASPRDVRLVYDLRRAPGATAVDVEIRRGGEALRRAELRVPPGATQLEHEVRLPTGAYEVVVRLVRPGAVVRTTREIDVRESGPVLIAVGP
jgi:hypothetical protein